MIIPNSHNSNPQSKQSLALLRSALSQPYPPATSTTKSGSHALEFELSVTENTPPTPDQIRILLSYLKLPLSSLISAHPTAGSLSIDSAEALVQAASKNPTVFRYPVIVDWENGDAALDVGGVKKMLDKLAESRGKGGADNVDQSKKWFS